jgi:hypothetical protein
MRAAKRRVEFDSCEWRSMPRPPPTRSDDITVYLVLNDYEDLGSAYVETDPAEATRESIIGNFLSGRYGNPVRVVGFNTAEGWCRDVSEDMAGELLERAFDADDNLTEGTKRFINRHMKLGEKRPPAPSVRLQSRGEQRRLAAWTECQISTDELETRSKG